MRADLAELVHGGVAAQDHPVADLDVAGEGGAVGEHDLVADHAVVRDVRVGHEQVVVADAVTPLSWRGAAIDGAALAEHVAVADLQARRLAVVLLVLRRIADARRTGRPGCPRRCASWPLMTTCGPMTRARPDAARPAPMMLNGPTSRRRASCAPGDDDRARIDHCRRLSGATIMSASATSCSPTSGARGEPPDAA